MGRLQYYFRKAQQRYQNEGFYGTFHQTFHFLTRRKFFLQFFFEWFEYKILSPQRSLEKTVLQVLKKQPLQGSKVLLYASYDKDSALHNHVLEQLRFFRSQDYEIIFVSTSPALPPREWNKIEPLVKVGIHRRNEGYDFASWGLAFTYISKPEDLTSLIILNDSCLGPEYDFSPALKIMETQTEVAYGITKTYEIAEYIQSYFIHFGSNLLKGQVVKDYFARIRILRSKWGIVRYFEIGGSRFLSQRGIELRALVDPKLPEIARKMAEFNLSDPVVDPAGKEWVKLKLSPFYKRSNQAGKAKSGDHNVSLE